MNVRRFSLPLCGCLLLLAGCEQTPPPDSADTQEPQYFGRFEGDVIASWDADGRNMTLREDFAYVDAQDRRWVAPRGSVVNGASIPGGFWSFIGGPFEGKYRNASVVHDVGCEEMTASWEDVHRTFYEACRCGGVDETTAKMLYFAVYHFGPRWEPQTVTQLATREAANGQVVEEPVTVRRMVRIDPPPPTLDEVEQVASLVVEENPAPTTIERTSRDSLRRRPRRSSARTRMTTGVERASPTPFEFSRPKANFSDLTREPPARARQTPPSLAAPNQRAAGSRGVGARQPATAEEQQWASELVRQRIERQAGQQRPAEYSVERSGDGYRVQVDYVHLNERGEPVGYTGASSVRLSRDGRVQEMINGAPARLR
jgi:hypothetical protein